MFTVLSILASGLTYSLVPQVTYIYGSGLGVFSLTPLSAVFLNSDFTLADFTVTPSKVTPISVLAFNSSIKLFFKGNSLTNNDLITIEILSIKKFATPTQDKPSRVRFSFYIDNVFVAGSLANSPVRTSQVTTPTSSFALFPPIENLSITISVITLFLALYTVIQRRQTVYNMLPLLTFLHTLYFFSFGNYQFGDGLSYLLGFRFSLLKFFPNFFINTIPTGYTQAASWRFTILTLDASMLRNAGESISLWFVLIAVVIWYLIQPFELIKDHKKKLKAAVTTLLTITWTNVYFFSFADIYNNRSNFSQIGYTRTSFGFSILFFIVLTLVPFGVLYLRLTQEENKTTSLHFWMQFGEFLKRMVYTYLIVATSGYGPIAIPIIQFFYTFFLVYYTNKKRIFYILWGIFEVITYFLIVCFSNYDASMIVICTIASLFMIFFQLYLVFGQFFFDRLDDQNTGDDIYAQGLQVNRMQGVKESQGQIKELNEFERAF